MVPSKDQAHAPIERWRLWLGIWLGRFLIIPLAAMSGGLVFALSRVLVTGKINTVSRGFRSSSSVYTFAENPVLFLVFFALFAVLTGLVIFVTVFVARRVTKGTLPS